MLGVVTGSAHTSPVKGGGSRRFWESWHSGGSRLPLSILMAALASRNVGETGVQGQCPWGRQRGHFLFPQGSSIPEAPAHLDLAIWLRLGSRGFTQLRKWVCQQPVWVATFSHLDFHSWETGHCPWRQICSDGWQCLWPGLVPSTWSASGM